MAETINYEYVIVSGEHYRQLEIKVTELLNKGWELAGNLQIVGPYRDCMYAQPMMKQGRGPNE